MVDPHRWREKNGALGASVGFTYIKQRARIERGVGMERGRDLGFLSGKSKEQVLGKGGARTAKRSDANTSLSGK